jgi:hypothetical protein|tara:strand:- start:10314 stop:10841 length:528 start_codon:yes stop_codon:yes gene_type:complete
MALSLNAADSCKFLSVIINYSAQQATNLQIDIIDANGIPVNGNLNPTFTIQPGSPAISYPIPVNNLTVDYGIITVVLNVQNGGEIDRQTVLLHCDIDCCLTKLTNELIDCHCDCARCSKTLAKAQKVFLLLDSANYALVQANGVPLSQKPGFIDDANSKYLKAKEICDESCGCDC